MLFTEKSKENRLSFLDPLVTYDVSRKLLLLHYKHLQVLNSTIKNSFTFLHFYTINAKNSLTYDIRMDACSAMHVCVCIMRSYKNSFTFLCNNFRN